MCWLEPATGKIPGAFNGDRLQGFEVVVDEAAGKLTALFFRSPPTRKIAIEHPYHIAE